MLDAGEKLDAVVLLLGLENVCGFPAGFRFEGDVVLCAREK
jgi:hypothetical protein